MLEAELGVMDTHQNKWDDSWELIGAMFDDRPHEFHALPLIVGGKPFEEAVQDDQFHRKSQSLFLHPSSAYTPQGERGIEPLKIEDIFDAGERRVGMGEPGEGFNTPAKILVRGIDRLDDLPIPLPFEELPGGGYRDNVGVTALIACPCIRIRRFQRHHIRPLAEVGGLSGSTTSYFPHTPHRHGFDISSELTAEALTAPGLPDFDEAGRIPYLGQPVDPSVWRPDHTHAIDHRAPAYVRAAEDRLQRADLRWVTAAAGLDIADIHVAILEPASPSIGVDRGVFQDQLPCMRGSLGAPYFDTCRLIALWWHPVISIGHPHHHSSLLMVSYIPLPIPLSVATVPILLP
jgi:hypothetical protein